MLGMSSLAKTLEERLETTRRSVADSGAKILIFDIERLKGTAEIEFWSLSDYKNRRIHADSVITWPRTICVAWNWFGENKIHFASEWDDGPEGMFQRVWEAFDEADILVGHNIAGFDIKHLNSAWRDLGLPPPSPYKVVDTLKEARKYFGDESKTLDALCKRLDLTAKTDKYDADTARAAVAGDKKAQKRIQGYNCGDITASLALYQRLRGWMPTHPHLGPFDDDRVPRCNQCNSQDITRNGTYLAVQIRYIQYRCQDCGANLRGASHSRSSDTRGVK